MIADKYTTSRFHVQGKMHVRAIGVGLKMNLKKSFVFIHTHMQFIIKYNKTHTHLTDFFFYFDKIYEILFTLENNLIDL